MPVDPEEAKRRLRAGLDDMTPGRKRAMQRGANASGCLVSLYKGLLGLILLAVLLLVVFFVFLARG